MTKILSIGAVMVASVWVVATSPTFVSTWKAPAAGVLNFAGKRVAALVITDDTSLRMSAEEALAREISARGPRGVAAYTLIPREALTDKAAAKTWFERTAVDGVVAMRVVGVDKDRVYSAVVWSSGTYGNFYDYYNSSWATVTPIGKGHIETTVAVETLLYRVSDAALLWASVSQTTNPTDAGSFMKGLVSAVVKQLQREGMIAKGSK